MTGRKPPGVQFQTWVERQIDEARKRGSFDDLPGAGKPLPSLDKPRDTMAWVAQKVHSEDLPVSALLPESLVLAKEVEDLRTRLAKEHTERRARAVVIDLNKRILTAIRCPQAGPPMRVVLQDVDAVLEQWRRDRAV